MRIQSLSGSRDVKRGHDAVFVVWVWSTKAASRAVMVSASTGSTRHVGAVKFTVCPAPHRATCDIGNLPAGQADELQVAVRVRDTAAIGALVRISAKATGKGARKFTGRASDIVVAAHKVVPSSSPSLSPQSSFPTIPGTGVSPSNPSGLFPTVGASPNPSPSSLGPPANRVRAADAAATVPLDARLIGGQLAGLAVLAGAVMMAIARLSLRTPKPPERADAEARKS